MCFLTYLWYRLLTYWCLFWKIEILWGYSRKQGEVWSYPNSIKSHKFFLKNHSALKTLPLKLWHRSWTNPYTSPQILKKFLYRRRIRNDKFIRFKNPQKLQLRSTHDKIKFKLNILRDSWKPGKAKIKFNKLWQILKSIIERIFSFIRQLISFLLFCCLLERRFYRR